MFNQKKDHQSDLEFFTVYDSKSKSYSEPFPSENEEVCKRDFLNAFRSPEAIQKNRYYQNAEDFSIFKIGSFDKKTGKLLTHEVHHIVNLHDLRSLSKPSESPRALSTT